MEKKKYTPEYKARLVIEALREEKTVSEIAAREGINKNLLQNWRNEFIENSAKVFSGSRTEKEAKKQTVKQQEEKEALEKKVGQLIIENDWLKKKSADLLGAGWAEKSGFR